MDRTMTPMGGRKLRDWLLHPLIRIEEVQARLETVRAFKESGGALEALRGALERIGDLERLLARLHLGAGNARDLLHLGRSLDALPVAREALADLADMTDDRNSERALKVQPSAPNAVEC